MASINPRTTATGYRRKVAPVSSGGVAGGPAAVGKPRPYGGPNMAGPGNPGQGGNPAWPAGAETWMAGNSPSTKVPRSPGGRISDGVTPMPVTPINSGPKVRGGMANPVNMGGGGGPVAGGWGTGPNDAGSVSGGSSYRPNPAWGPGAEGASLAGGINPRIDPRPTPLPVTPIGAGPKQPRRPGMANPVVSGGAYGGGVAGRSGPYAGGGPSAGASNYRRNPAWGAGAERGTLRSLAMRNR